MDKTIFEETKDLEILLVPKTKFGFEKAKKIKNDIKKERFTLKSSKDIITTVLVIILLCVLIYCAIRT